jgi:hypothetical protein
VVQSPQRNLIIKQKIPFETLKKKFLMVIFGFWISYLGDLCVLCGKEVTTFHRGGRGGIRAWAKPKY